MGFVGGSVGVSAELADAPLAAAQALRYAAACLLLLTAARLAGVPLHRPRGAEWGWLAAVTGTGLLLFNVALVRGAGHADPAVFGVAVAGVPVALALAGPLLEGRRPRAGAVLAALAVTAGAALVQGFGRSDATGLLWALVVLLCEVGFTLLAVPVLARHGAWGVSVHTTWMATAAFGLAAVAAGEGAPSGLTGRHLLAVAYLALAVTAVAFVLWYSCVRRLGPARAGLLTGVAPVAAAVSGMLLGGPAPAPAVWAGIAVVAAGLGLGLLIREPAAVGAAPASGAPPRPT
ncbi:EamA family transporter [Kineococcus xinjiangensis]